MGSGLSIPLDVFLSIKIRIPNPRLHASSLVPPELILRQHGHLIFNISVSILDCRDIQEKKMHLLMTKGAQMKSYMWICMMDSC